MHLVTSKDQLTKQAIAHRFSRAAEQYAHYATLQRLTGDRLLSRAPFSQQGLLLDLGCGEGHYSRQLRKHGHSVVALDLAGGMLRQARGCHSADWYINADLDRLPLRTGSINKVWSNLALQWSADQVQAIRQLLTLVTEQGQLRFTTLSDGSLPELAIAFGHIGHQAPANQFICSDWLSGQFRHSSLQLDVEPLICRFDSALEAMWSLKGVGATHLYHRQQRRALNRHKLQQLEQYWPRDPLGYRVTYQVIYGVLN